MRDTPDSPPAEAAEDADTTVATPGDVVTEEAPPAGGGSWGRYEILHLVGRGGMGRVYKAHDPTLQRNVALKIISEDSDEARVRFVREASSQARVDHPNVCKVYEAGQAVDDATGLQRLYIAMQYIDGRTLAELRDALTIEQKLEVMRQAAEGLHAAHRIGLVHRDVKPSNIIVAAGPDGAWIPYVTDFGIAKGPEHAGITTTGIALGTPGYMAPEQIRSEIGQIGRRSDVYSIGATLYWLLLGRPPHSRPTAIDTLVSALDDDPAPPRSLDPSVPRDVDTIVMKCLAREPAGRYDSAKAVADDLRRYLDGDPIAARPAGMFYRAATRIRKHKVLVAVSTAAALLVLVFAGLWARSRWAAAEQTRAAQGFGQDIESIESILERSHLLPLHDTTAERAIVVARMASIADQMERLGRASRGPGNFALGRGHLALGDPARALLHLRRAWEEDGYTTPEVAWALGQALAERFREEMQDAEEIEEESRREERRRQCAVMYRDPAIEYLRRGRLGTAESADHVEAVIAHLSGQEEAALEHARRAVSIASSDRGALRILGDVYARRARAMRFSGKTQEALGLYMEAESAYGRAVEIGRSDGRMYEAISVLCSAVMRMFMSQGGGDPREWYEKGLAAADSAIASNPGSGIAYHNRAVLRIWLGEYQTETGEDPAGAFEAGKADATRAAELRPDDSNAREILGLVDWDKGHWMMRNGEDPREVLRGALESYERAVRLSRVNIEAVNGVGGINLTLAQYDLNQGEDPSGSLDRAIAAYSRGLDVVPADESLLTNIGISYGMRGEQDLRRGIDPRQAWERGAGAFDGAIKSNPADLFPYSNSGNLFVLKAAYELGARLDYTATLERAFSRLRYAVETRPTFGSARMNLVAALLVQADAAISSGKSAAGPLDEALHHIAQAKKLSPKNPDILFRLGQTWLMKARSDAASGRPPGGALSECRAALNALLEEVPDDTQALVHLAESAAVEIEYSLVSDRARTSRDSLRALVQRGIEFADRAAAIDAGFPAAMAVKGRLLLRRSELGGIPAAASADVRAARELIGKALSLNPSLKLVYERCLIQATKLEQSVAR